MRFTLLRQVIIGTITIILLNVSFVHNLEGSLAAPETSLDYKKQTTFNDINGHWAETYVNSIALLKVVTGYPDGTFRPNSPISRAEFLVMLFRSFPVPGNKSTTLQYTDSEQIPGWASPAITAAAANQIMIGYGDGTIRPNSYLTRAEASTLLFRTLKAANIPTKSSKSETSPLNQFIDRQQIPSWARQSIENLIAFGYLIGREKNLLAPASFISRAEAAALLYRALAVKNDSGREAALPQTASSVALLTATNKSLEVLAFYPVDYPGDRIAYDSLVKHAGYIDTVAAFLHRISSTGNILGEPDPRLMRVAKQTGTRVLALVHNWQSSGFNRNTVHKVLSNPTIRKQAIENIFKLVVANSYSGVNIDFENVPPSDRQNYTQFIAELADRLHPNYLVTISIPAKLRDDPKNEWTGAFDYKALGKYADKVVIMAYDEHWATGVPGPIASVGWVEAVANYAASNIPSQKLLLGVAAYGYDWPLNGGSATVIRADQAPKIASQYRAQIQWNEDAQVPYFYYWKNREPRVVYYENSYSLPFKLRIAKKYGMSGIAIWRLGYEDIGIWTKLSFMLPDIVA